MSNFSSSTPPTTPGGGSAGDAPAVIRWYKIYAVFMAVVYAALGFLGYYLLQNPDSVLATTRDLAPEDLRIRAIVLVTAGVTLTLGFLVSLFQPRTSGAWIFQTVLIAIGLGNCCLWLVTIPLMIGWLKPETQRWFGRNPDGTPPRDSGTPPPPIPTA